MGQLDIIAYGSPAVSVKPVVFRPCLAAGLALSCVYKKSYGRVAHY